MLDPTCHLCDHANATGARFCAACGVGLAQQCGRCGTVRAGLWTTCGVCGAIDSVVTPERPAPRRPAPPPAFESSDWGGLPVLSLTDAVPVASLRLLDMDRPEVWVMPDGQPVLRPTVPSSSPPGLVRTDSFLAPPGALPAPPLSAPAATVPVAPVDLRDAKAARRAAVRRTRQAQLAAGADPLDPMPIDLLVVDSDDATRQQLCLLLDSFGFNVQSSRSTAHAAALLSSHVYLAVFADVDLQDDRPEGGVEVCRRTVEGGPLPDGRRPALIIMSARPGATERVRAALAGSEQFLVKPLSRGHVARALEACDIPLPVDPRRS